MNEITSAPEQQAPALASAFMQPTNVADAIKVAEYLAKSDFVPKDYKGKPGNIVACMQFGAELNLPVMQALQNIAVINGHPSIYGDLALALCERSGLLDAINEQHDDKGATCTVKRKGRNAMTRVFTMADAKQAGLAGKAGPWTQYPKRMLQMRARGFALRDAFPDVLKGIAIREEAQDREPIDITPPPTVIEGDPELLDALKYSATQQQTVDDLKHWLTSNETDIQRLNKDQRAELVTHWQALKTKIAKAEEPER